MKTVLLLILEELNTRWVQVILRIVKFSKMFQDIPMNKPMKKVASNFS